MSISKFNPADLMIWRSPFIMSCFAVLFLLAHLCVVATSRLPTPEAQRALLRVVIGTLIAFLICTFFAIHAKLKQRKRDAEQNPELDSVIRAANDRTS